ncbi:MAG: hypothetical protein AB7N73_10995 [Gemmatimonadales bacterium]
MMERRRMLGILVAGSAGLAASGSPSLAAAAPVPGADRDDWLDALASRRHKAFLDIRSYATDGTPFRKAANLMRALTEAYGAKPEEVGIAFGAGSSSIGHILGPAIWEEYKVGAKVAGHARSPEEAASLRTEPRKWATLNGEEIATMRKMGIRVLGCRNSIARWSRDFAAESGESPEAVNAKLLAGLHEGVEPVPAMIAAAVLAQGRDLSYVAIG